MRTLRLFIEAGKAFWEDNAMRMGASIAYYTLFAIAPILIIVIAVAGAVFGPEAVRGEIVSEVDELIGDEGARALQALLEGASRDRHTPMATAIGIGTLVFAATGAFMQLQAAFNTIWRASASGSAIRSFLISRMQAFGLVLALGFLLLVSLIVSAALAVGDRWVDAYLPFAPLVLELLHGAVALSISMGLFTLLFRYLPDTQVRWKDAAVGAFITAGLFAVGKHVIGFYLGRTAVASVYGTAGSVLLLLLWVYYAAQIVLYGAEFTRLYAERNDADMRVADEA